MAYIKVLLIVRKLGYFSRLHHQQEVAAEAGTKWAHERKDGHYVGESGQQIICMV